MEMPFVDLHFHSTHSDGRTPLGEMVRRARELGIQYFAITDHYSDERFASLYRRMNRKQLMAYLAEARALGVCTGVEADLLPGGVVALEKSDRPRLDLVIGGLHQLRGHQFFVGHEPIEDPEGFAREIGEILVGAMRSGLVDVIAHPTKLPDSIAHLSERLFDEAWEDRVIDTAAETSVALEINETSRVPGLPFVKKCLARGVKISLGSDAHEAAQLGRMDYCREMVASAGVQPGQIFLPPVFLQRKAGFSQEEAGLPRRESRGGFR